jgi:hypothetical protein
MFHKYSTTPIFEKAREILVYFSDQFGHPNPLINYPPPRFREAQALTMFYSPSQQPPPKAGA